MKKIIEVYEYYGKCDGDTMQERFLIDSELTPLEIIELLKEKQALDVSSCYDIYAFITGNSNSFNEENADGDWDDPTSFGYVVTTKEKLIEQAEQEYQNKLNNIELLFTEEVE